MTESIQLYTEFWEKDYMECFSGVAKRMIMLPPTGKNYYSLKAFGFNEYFSEKLSTVLPSYIQNVG